ncbi:MAG: hypothetical protein JOY65_02720 [Acetobacteraceae bacterium]|nr:hypothetical protein [Acetobacteraceae bacterium]MBV9777615.1 hypothetical protein [Acetobacteraceae bacterium]
MTTAAARGVRDNATTPPRVAVVMPSDVPALMSAMTAGDKSAAQLLPPVLKLVEHIRSKKGRGSTCPCCRERISGPFATVLIYKAGSAEPSFAAAICTDCASTAEEATAVGEVLARRMWESS